MDVRRAIIVPSNVKSIQRGVITLAGGVSSAVATVSAVNAAKSELRFLGFSQGDSSFSVGTPQSVFPNVVLTNATTVTASKVGAGGVGSVFASWELTEFN